jgi:hypothetical protein
MEYCVSELDDLCTHHTLAVACTCTPVAYEGPPTHARPPLKSLRPHLLFSQPLYVCDQLIRRPNSRLKHLPNQLHVRRTLIPASTRRVPRQYARCSTAHLRFSANPPTPASSSCSISCSIRYGGAGRDSSNAHGLNGFVLPAMPSPLTTGVTSLGAGAFAKLGVQHTQ